MAPTTADDESLADLAAAILRTAREILLVEEPPVRLTPSQSAVMRWLDTHEGATPSALADGIGLQRSNLSVVLRSLEEIGFLRRDRDPADGRGSLLHKTDAARRNLAAVRADWADRLRTALGDTATPAELVGATVLLAAAADGLVHDRRARGFRGRD